MVITRAQEASTNHAGGHPQRWLGGTLNELRNGRPSLCSTITTTSGDSYLTVTSASKSFSSLFSCFSGQLSSIPREISPARDSPPSCSSAQASSSSRARAHKQGRRRLPSDQLASLGGTGYYDPRFIKARRATWKEGRALQPTSAEQWDDNDGGDSLELFLQWEDVREGDDVMVIIERVVKTMLSPYLPLPPFYDEHVMGVQSQCGCQTAIMSLFSPSLTLPPFYDEHVMGGPKSMWMSGEETEPSCHSLLPLSLIFIVSGAITWEENQIGGW